MADRGSHEARAEAAARWYGRLLRIYPASFRRRYGRDATELFVDQYREAIRTGRRARVRLIFVTFVGALWHGLLERADEARPSALLVEAGAVVRAAFRRVVRAPAMTATVVVTLALGIGANVALYSVLRSVLIRPLPYPEADRLVQLWEVNPSGEERTGPSPWNFVDWSEAARGLESMTAWYLTSGTFRRGAWVEEVRSAQVTPDFFRTLRVEPLHGRVFRPDEVDRYGPVVLSHRLWSRAFGSDPSVVGSTIVASGQTYTIVGVMPPGFAFPDGSVEAWVAWSLPVVYADRPEYRGARFLQAVGRMDAAVSIGDVDAEMRAVAEGLERAYPELNAGWSAEVSSLHDEVVGEARGTLWVAFGAVSFILLIACANVANLLLARVPARTREVGLRAALGASRGRIALELAAEHAALGLLAGGLGLVVGMGLLEALVALDAGRIPRLEEVSFDGGVLAFTVGAALLTTLLFGSAPVLQLVRASSGAARGGRRSAGGPEHRVLRAAFVGAQLAIALVLLAGAGLFSVSLQRLAAVDPGLDPRGVATFRVSLDPVEGGAAEIVRYYRQLEEALRSVPGVEAVGGSQAVPMNPVTNDFQRPYRPALSGLSPADAPTVNMRIVTAGYVEAMGMRLLEGPGMPAAVEADAPLVALVSRTLAERLFPDGGAVGSSFEIDFREGWQPYRVVGVVEDVRHYGPRSEPVPEVFLSHAQVPYLAMTMAVRTAGDPRAYFDLLDEAVRGVPPEQPAHNFVSMDELLVDATAEERFLSLLLRLLAGVGLLLSVTGVYAVIAFTVSRRRREIGVRIALGANGGDVATSVLSDVGRSALVGVAAGLAVVLLLGGLVEQLLFGVSSTDAPTLGLVTIVLAVAAAAAAWAPARRATRIPPGEALRAE